MSYNKECNNCEGSGSINMTRSCDMCDGVGFITVYTEKDQGDLFDTQLELDLDDQ